MFGLISMKKIRTDFDGAMNKQGYVRAKVMCERWEITTNQLSKAFQKGYTCDNFIVNGVRYISIYADPPIVGAPKKKDDFEVIDIDLSETVDPETIEETIDE